MIKLISHCMMSIMQTSKYVSIVEHYAVTK